MIRKQLAHSIFAPLILLLANSSAHAQSSSYADMRTWELEGVAGGNWVDPANITQPFVNATSGRSVFQTVNNTSGTMFLVSNDSNVINRAVWGTLQIKSRHTDSLGQCAPSCASNESDDDWIGFVVGYRDVAAPLGFPEQYIGFTWSQGGTSPYSLPNGPALYLVNARGANAPSSTTGNPPAASVLRTSPGGWAYNTEYQFRIVYTTSLIRVYINDVLRLQATATEAGVSQFSAGQFGFTNASQANVLFGNVREADASALDSEPVAVDDMFYYGLTWGASYDNTNVFNTSTDPRASGILANDYDPDGDLFTLRVGGVDLDTDGESTVIPGTQGGSFQVFRSGHFIYTAASDYQTRGPYQDTFDYTLFDGDGSNTATVTVTVQQTNTPPDNITLLDTDTSTTDVRIDEGAAPGTPVGNISTVENDNPGEIDAYDYELANAANGAFAINGNVLVVRDTAALGSAGVRQISIRSTDVEGQSVTRTFNITVDPNALPTTSNASVNVHAIVPYEFSVANFPFNDTDGDTLQRILITSVPASGTLFLDVNDDGIAQPSEVIQINFNDVASRAQLNAGTLKYLSSSATDTSTTFTFRVQDGSTLR